jgi:hypothetical protein
MLVAQRCLEERGFLGSEVVDVDSVALVCHLLCCLLRVALSCGMMCVEVL